MEFRLEELMNTRRRSDRRHFIGGSDARIIMSPDEAALIRLWKEKRGEVDPEDLLGQSDCAARRRHRGAQSGLVRAQYRPRGRGRPALGPASGESAGWPPRSTGMVEGVDAVFEAKFMLPWSFSEEAAAEKHMAQLQHNMWVTNARSAALSIITGGGKWIEITIPADALYQHFLVTAEHRFWRCVQSGDTPRPYGVEPPSRGSKRSGSLT